MPFIVLHWPQKLLRLTLVALLLGTSMFSRGTALPVAGAYALQAASPSQTSCIPASPLPPRAYLPIVSTALAAPLPTIRFESSLLRVSEQQATLNVVLRLDKPSASTILVDFYTSDDTAVASQDYTAVSGTLTFPAGQTSQTFPVPIRQDTIVEGNEHFLLRLASPRRATLAYIGPAQVTIVDDDSQTALQTTLSVNPLTARRPYQWAVIVNPDSDAVSIPPAPQTQQVGFSIDVRRGSLGNALYDLSGTISVLNTGNIPATLSDVKAQIQYHVGTSQWLTVTGDIQIERFGTSITPGQQKHYPFVVSFSFLTPDGTPPATLSALRVVGLVTAFDQSQQVVGPYEGMAPLATPLPTPAITNASVTVVETGSITPTGMMTISGGGQTRTVADVPLVAHSVYTVQRQQPGDATLQHHVAIAEIGTTVVAESKLQLGAVDLPTLEIRDLEPRVSHTNAAVPYTVTVRVRPGAGLNPNAIHLVEVDTAGTVVRTLSPFLDDGLHGDRLPGDGLFGATGTVVWTAAGTKLLAARATLLNASMLVAQAPELTIIQQLPRESWDTFTCVGQRGEAKFRELRAIHPLPQAQQLLVEWIRGLPGVAAVVLVDNAFVEVQYASGLSNAIWVANPASERLGSGPAGPATGDSIAEEQTYNASSQLALVAPTGVPTRFPGTNQAIILNTLPLHQIATVAANEVGAMLRLAGYEVTIKYDTLADIPTFKQLNTYGIVHTLGHGGFTNDGSNQYTFTTGDEVNTGILNNELELYKDDIQLKHLSYMHKDRRVVFFIRTSFFRTYYAGKTFPNTLWTMLNCNGLGTQDFANLLLAKGVKGFVSFNGIVNIYWGREQLNRLYTRLVQLRLPLGEAFDGIPTANSPYNWAEDGTNYVVTFAMATGSDRTLGLLSAGFINGDFETGTFSGWARADRALVEVFRVPTQYEHLAGRYAVRLGPPSYPPACGTCNPRPGTDRLIQTIVVPQNARSLSFDYVLSTYLPSNGSFNLKIYQGTSSTLLESRVIKSYPGSGQQYPDFWYSGAQTYTYNVQRFAGKQIRVVFENQQNGGSDQAVYIDNILIR